MAKSGLDYFPLACSFDDKVELIEAEYGLKGLAVLVKLLQKIYGERGYYCEWNEEVELLFSRKACGLGDGDNLVSEVIKSAVKRGFFSKEHFEKYGILTSAGIQKRYFEAAKRRTELEVVNEYLLISVDIFEKNVCKNVKNVNISSKNVSKNQQSKVEESKGKKRKEDNKDIPVSDETASASKQAKKKYGEYGHVLLTDDERDRLFTDYGEMETLKAIKYLDDCIEMKGYKYKSHNLALRKWVFNAIKEDEIRQQKLNGSMRNGRQQANDNFFDGIADWVSKNQEGGTGDGCDAIL